MVLTKEHRVIVMRHDSFINKEKKGIDGNQHRGAKISDRNHCYSSTYKEHNVLTHSKAS